jgi:Zn-dependent protease
MIPQPHFSVLRVPVHVQGFFWLLGFWLASRSYTTGSLFNGSFHIAEPISFVLFFVILFQAVLMHELGHALVGRRFGAEPFVVLTAFGGYTQWTSAPRFTPGRQAIVSFAGPLVGLVIGGAVLVYRIASPVAHGAVVDNAMGDIVWTNFGWALFNLLPIVGLDGGNIMAALFDKGFGPRGVRAALVVSMFVAAAIIALSMALWSLAPQTEPPIWTLFLFGFLAMQNYRQWQMLGRWSDKLQPQAAAARAARPVAGPSDERIEAEIERGFRALEERNATLVRTIGEALAPHARTNDQRFQIAHLVAWGRLLSGDVGGARRALQQLMPTGQLPDALLEGAIRLELGNASDAVGSLTEALVDRNDDFVATRLARAVVSSGRVEPVVKLLEKDDVAKAIGARPFQILSSELAYAGRHDAAREVGELLFARFAEAADAFNVACALGRLHRADDALLWLDKALEAGLPDKSVLDTDEDIAAVRELPGFQALRAKAGL